MGNKYWVNWAYRDGNPHTQGFDLFTSALELYHTFRAENVIRGSVVVSISSENAEHDGERWHDGLTDDERDQL